METIKYRIKISDRGQIIIPMDIAYKDEEVEVTITPTKSKKYTASNFIQDFSGILKDVDISEVENAKLEHLVKKHCQ